MIKTIKLAICLLSLLPNYCLAQYCKDGIGEQLDRYVEIEHGVILDKLTNLEWMKCSIGLYGDHCELGMIETFQIHKAFDKVGKINSMLERKWRLPTIEELASIRKEGCVKPAVELSVFPNTRSAWYWTSTADRSYYSYVDFSVGYIGEEDMYLSNLIRLVRNHEK